MGVACKKMEMDCNFTSFTDKNTGHIILPEDTIEGDSLDESTHITMKVAAPVPETVTKNPEEVAKHKAHHQKVAEVIEERAAKRAARVQSGPPSEAVVKMRKERKEQKLMEQASLKAGPMTPEQRKQRRLERLTKDAYLKQ